MADEIRFVDGSVFEVETLNWTGNGADPDWLVAEGRFTGYDHLNPGPLQRIEAPASSLLCILKDPD